jgi:hypothetical protein
MKNSLNNNFVKENLYYAYGHEKFCKKVSFYYFTKKEIINDITYLVLSILLLNDGEEEQEVISSSIKLLNKYQWHCSIKLNEEKILPVKVIKKDIDQDDLIIFGKHLSYGNIFQIYFIFFDDNDIINLFLIFL